MDDLPPEANELRGIPDHRMPLLQAALLQRTMDDHSRTGDLCDRCRRTVLTGEHVFVCSGQRIVCELCIGSEPAPPLERRLVHGSELGNTIRVVDKRSREAARPVARTRRRPSRISGPGSSDA